jgi:predicted Zn-dependent protease
VRVPPAPAAATPPVLGGARPPAGCEHSALGPGCFGWYLDRVLVEIAVTEVPDPALNAYVTGVGERLARAGGMTMPLQFRVIDDLDPQAESFIGGAIYVHRGALVRLRSEAELAALLGHELGHVMGGHAGFENAPSGVGRDDEIQADEVSVRLVAAAGYDPRAVETMLRALAAEAPLACADDDDDDHPCMRDRIARIRARVAGRHTGDLGVERFRAGTRTMVTGDDPLRASVTPASRSKPKT